MAEQGRSSRHYFCPRQDDRKHAGQPSLLALVRAPFVIPLAAEAASVAAICTGWRSLPARRADQSQLGRVVADLKQTPRLTSISTVTFTTRLRCLHVTVAQLPYLPHPSPGYVHCSAHSDALVTSARLRLSARAGSSSGAGSSGATVRRRFDRGIGRWTSRFDSGNGRPRRPSGAALSEVFRVDGASPVHAVGEWPTSCRYPTLRPRALRKPNNISPHQGG